MLLSHKKKMSKKKTLNTTESLIKGSRNVINIKCMVQVNLTYDSKAY